MAEIDNLEIKIQSSIQNVNNDLTKLVSGLKSVSEAISQIGKIDGFNQVINKSNQLSQSMSTVADKTKAATEKMSSSMSKVQQTATNSYKGYNREALDYINSFGKTADKAEEFKKVLEGIKPLEFSGNFFEMEKWLDSLDKKAAVLQEKLDKLGELGVAPDTQRIKSLQYDLQETVLTLGKYEGELEKARAAGELKINVSSIDEGVQRAKSKFLGLQGVLRNLRITVPTDGLQKVESDMEKVRQKYNSIVETINRKSQTVSFYGTTSDYKNKMVELEALRNKYQGLINKQTELSRAGGGGLGINPEIFTKLGNAATVAGKGLLVILAPLKKLGLKMAEFGKRVLLAIPPINLLKKSMNGFSLSNVGLAKSLFKVTNMLKLMLTRMALRGAINAAKEGFQNLAQYSNEFNASASMVLSALAQMKNAFAVAFAPIMNIVLPILSNLISMLSAAANAIGRFLSALTGKSYAVQAIKVQQDYAKSLNGTAGAAKNATKALADYDELRVVQSKDSGGGGGGGADLTPADMFETVEIESAITDFTNKLRAAFEAGDFAGLGKIIADKINEELAKLKDFISWGNLKDAIVPKIKAFADTFNSLVDNLDWNLLGKTIGTGINTIVNTLYTFLTSIDWENLGRKFADGINGIFQSVNWYNLGAMLGAGVMALVNTLNGFVVNLDWGLIGTSIGQALNGAVLNIDFKKIAATAATLFNGLFQMLLDFVTTFNWKELGNRMVEGANTALRTIDLGLMGGALSSFVIGVLDLLIAILKGYDWQQLGNQIVSFFLSIDWAGLVIRIAEVGYYIIFGMLKGMMGALATIGTWIKTNVVDPIVNTVKNLFGIHSPSTVFAAIGEDLINGLFQGIQKVWSTFISGITNLFNDVLKVATETWENIYKTVTNKTTELSKSLSTTWNSIKSSATTLWENIKTTINQKQENIRQTTTTAWNNIRSAVSTALSGMLSNINSSFSSMVSTISSKVSSAYSAIQSGFNNAVSFIKGLSSSAKTWGSDMITGFANGISSAMSKVTSAAKSVANKVSSYLHFSRPDVGPLREYETWMPDFMRGLARGIETNRSLIESAVANVSEGMVFTPNFSVPDLVSDFIPSIAGTYSQTNQSFGITEQLADTIASSIVDSLQNGDSSPVNVNVTIEGEMKKFIKAIVSENNSYRKQTGTSLFGTV